MSQNDMKPTPDFRTILITGASSGLAQDDHITLTAFGVLAQIFLEPEPDNVQIMAECVVRGFHQAVREVALELLTRLAVTGNPFAILAIYHLAIHDDSMEAQEKILSMDIPASDPSQHAVFLLCTGQFSIFQQISGGKSLVLKYLQNHPDNQLLERIHAAMHRHGQDFLESIIGILQYPTREAFQSLLELYSRLSPMDQTLSLDFLQEQVLQSGSQPAMDAICELFILYEDHAALTMAVSLDISPGEPTRKALYYFLSQQWEKYENLDFSHRLLHTAFEASPAPLRRRILDLSRYSGAISWLQPISGTTPGRWIQEMSEGDWVYTIKELQTQGRLQDLWRLAQSAPPLWSVQILKILQQSTWQAEVPEVWTGFQTLCALAASCYHKPPEINPHKFLKSPQDRISALTLSPDGAMIAVGGMDSFIHRWKIPRGDWIPDPIACPVRGIQALQFSPDGMYLLAAFSDLTLRVLRLDDLKWVKTLEGHTAPIRSLAIHPDSRTAYSTGFDGTLRSWRFPLGPELRKIHQSDLEIFDLSLSLDGSLLLSAGADQVISVWNPSNGEKIRTLEGHLDTITCLSISNSGNLCASASRDRHLYLWNCRTGKQLHQIIEHHSQITAICFHPAEEILYCGNADGTVLLYSTQTGKQILKLSNHTQPVMGLTIQRSGEYLVTAASDGEIIVWNQELFLLSRSNLVNNPAFWIQNLQQKLDRPNQTTTTKNWLKFMLELARWQMRYDVQLEDETRVQLGEFDIIL